MEDKLNELEERVKKLEFIITEQGAELDTLHAQVQGLRGIKSNGGGKKNAQD